MYYICNTHNIYIYIYIYIYRERERERERYIYIYIYIYIYRERERERIFFYVYKCYLIILLTQNMCLVHTKHIIVFYFDILSSSSTGTYFEK